jgi:hypothetical protein
MIGFSLAHLGFDTQAGRYAEMEPNALRGNKKSQLNLEPFLVSGKGVASVHVRQTVSTNW